MENPAPATTPFHGLLEHLEQRLGPVKEVESAKSDQGNRGYDLTFYENPEPPVTTVVTNGLRFQTITSMRPEELVCSLWSGHRHIAHYLVDSVASMVIRHRQGMEYGTVIRNQDPIVEGTEITAIIGHTSPLFDEAFNLFPDSTEPRLQIISLVPITTPEANLAKAEGPDMLFEMFALNRTNILDIRRRSVA